MTTKEAIWILQYVDHEDSAFYEAVSFVIDALRTQDAEHIVHCKDCRYLYYKDFSAYCPHMASACIPYGFCNYGERRNNNA